MKLAGSCFCGAVRYECTAEPAQQGACHCTICRKTAGAPFVAWFTVPPSSFCFVSGKPRHFRSSEHATRTFCSDCGTPLTFESARCPGELDVTTCSLDDPERVPPRHHIYMRSALSWVSLADGLPRYAASREGD